MGAPRVSGLSRRPKWLSNSTTTVIAANLWRFLQASGGAMVSRGSFLRGQRIDRTGTCQQVVWRTRAERQLQLAYEEARKRYYEARDRWQANPVGPMPKEPKPLRQNSACTATVIEELPMEIGTTHGNRDSSVVEPPVLLSESLMPTCARTSAISGSTTSTSTVNTPAARVRQAPAAYRELRSTSSPLPAA